MSRLQMDRNLQEKKTHPPSPPSRDLTPPTPFARWSDRAAILDQGLHLVRPAITVLSTGLQRSAWWDLRPEAARTRRASRHRVAMGVRAMKVRCKWARAGPKVFGARFRGSPEIA